jgi:hypothetical protein
MSHYSRQLSISKWIGLGILCIVIVILAMKSSDYRRQLHAVSQLAEFRPTVIWKSGNVDFLTIIPWDGTMFIEDLKAGGKDFTDSSLDRIADFHDLTSLQLDGTKITDGGLSKLSHLHKLQHLSLSECSVTDVGMKHLVGLKQLEVLELNDTGVTEQGVRLLQLKLPKVRIYYAGNRWIDEIGDIESRRIEDVWKQLDAEQK